MTRNQRGFTLVELMVTMLIFVIAIAAASNMLTGLLSQFKQQSKIAESDVEGVVGLEMLRRDLEIAGSGLPWQVPDLNASGVPNESADWQALTNYVEAANDGRTPWDDTVYNDADSNPPRAFVIGQTAVGEGFQTAAVNETSDVLVVKAADISLNQAVRRWSYIANTGGLPNMLRSWGDAAEDPVGDDRVIVINPERGARRGILMTNGGTFFTTVAELPANGGTASSFEPTTNSYASFLVYGISGPDPANPDLRMPFNRADFYVRRPAAGMPTRCEPHTGILYKGVINQSDGMHTELPLLDCVGYMKAVAVFDPNNDGNLVAESPVSAGRDNAVSLRLIKQIRVYIVAQEGQRDPNYIYTNPSPPVAGCAGPEMLCINDIGGLGLLTPFTVPDRNYRWKLYTIVVTPTSLR